MDISLRHLCRACFDIWKGRSSIKIFSLLNLESIINGIQLYIAFIDIKDISAFILQASFSADKNFSQKYFYASQGFTDFLPKL